MLSHAAQRGSLVFDVGSVREAVDGSLACFRPAEHIARFLRSAALIGLEIPWRASELLDATLEVVRARGATPALVRWSAFVGTLEPDVVPRPGPASVVVAVLTPEDSAASGQPAAKKPATVRVGISRDIRKAGPEVFPTQAKVAASYLGPMLAKRRAVAAGYDEVVLLDREGLVAEAPTSNVFAVVGGALVTPPTDRVLAGITRATVLDLARAEGIPVREAHLHPEDLAGADEAFLTGTSLPVQAIAAIDGAALRGGAPGPVTTRVKELVRACERGNDPRFRGWLVPAR
jgi:branched-chain amino acid aminotransferase